MIYTRKKNSCVAKALVHKKENDDKGYQQFLLKHVIKGGKAAKDSLGGAWNLPVQAPAVPLSGAPAWSKSLSCFKSNKNLFRKEATKKALDRVLQSQTRHRSQT